MGEGAALEYRIAILERAQRRTRAALGLIVLAAASVATMAQSAGSQTVTAQEFVIVNGAGKVKARITGGKLLDFPGVEINDPDNKHMLSVERVGDQTDFLVNSGKSVGGFAVHAYPNLTRAIVFAPPSQVELLATSTYADVAVAGGELSHVRVAVQPKQVSAPPGADAAALAKWFAQPSKTNLDTKTAVDLSATANDALINASDEQGFEAQVGNAHLQTDRTGTTSRTSAATLLLFGSDKHVLWRVPQ